MNENKKSPDENANIVNERQNLTMRTDGLEEQYFILKRGVISMLILIAVILLSFLVACSNTASTQPYLARPVVTAADTQEERDDDLYQDMETGEETVVEEEAVQQSNVIPILGNVIQQKKSMIHDHQWCDDGFCVICGLECDHPHHDPETRRCTVCGAQRWHTFHNAVCTDCGFEWHEEPSWLPEWIYLDSLKPGNAETFLVDTPNMGKNAKKYIEVYTPNGYDPEGQYDVMMWFCGLQTPYSSFIGDVKYDLRRDQDKSIIMKHIWDNMIECGYCKPMIICSISTYTLDSNTTKKAHYDPQKDHATEGQLDDFWDTEVSVRDYIFPFIVDNFATYAKSSAPDDIRAARHHFGIGGFSNGGYFTVYSAMTNLVDYCSWFVPIAGSHGGTEAGHSMRDNWEQYPTDMVYFGCGGSDNLAYNKTRADYNNVRLGCPYLTLGENLFWDSPPDFGHDWDTGSTVCFNATQLLFSSNPD